MFGGMDGQRSGPSLIVNKGGVVIFDKIGDDGGTWRYLVLGDSINGAVQGVKNLSNPNFHLQQFTQHFMYAAVLAHPILKPSSILFLGLGAGIAVNGISEYFPSTEIHIVDNKKELFDYTHQYFNRLDRPNMYLYYRDAQDFIVSASRSFDMVFCDIFGAKLELPAFLLRDEFYGEIREIGAKLFVINTHAQIVKPLYEILTKKYKYVVSLAGNNTFLICSDESLRRPFDSYEIEKLHSMNIPFEKIVEHSVLIQQDRNTV